METLKTSFESILDWLHIEYEHAALAFQVFAVVFATLVVALIIKNMLTRLHKRLSKNNHVWDDALIYAARPPLYTIVWLLGICYAAKILNDSTDAIAFGEMITSIQKLGVVFTFAWFATRFIKMGESIVVSSSKKRVDKTTADAVGKLLRISILITAVLIALQTLGISISGVLAFGGVGGIVLGLAAKDLLSNFFGGLMVYMDRPFKVGDWIRSPDAKIEGTVETIGWRLTCIRDFETVPLYVPNSLFTTVTLENPSRTKYRRIRTVIGVRYDDFDKLNPIIDDMRKFIMEYEDIADDMSRRVHFINYNSSSLDIQVSCYAKTQDYSRYLDIQQDVLLKLGEIVNKHGAEIAFPTQTLLVTNET